MIKKVYSISNCVTNGVIFNSTKEGLENQLKELTKKKNEMEDYIDYENYIHKYFKFTYDDKSITLYCGKDHEYGAPVVYDHFVKYKIKVGVNPGTDANGVSKSIKVLDTNIVGLKMDLDTDNEISSDAAEKFIVDSMNTRHNTEFKISLYDIISRLEGELINNKEATKHDNIIMNLSNRR